MQKSKFITQLAIAISIAIPAEGIRHYAYRDPVGILTVCRGHTGADIVPGKKYSLAECDGLMTKDMTIALKQVNARWPGLPDGVAAPLADAVFHFGPKIIDPKQSTMARLIDAGKVQESCHQYARWTKAKVTGLWVELPGLVKRANVRKQICLSTFQ